MILLKRIYKKVVPVFPGYYYLCLFLRYLKRPGWLWVYRLPIPPGILVLVNSKFGSFVMSRPERCSIAKKFFWTRGNREPLEDRVALNLFSLLAQESSIVLDIGANSGVFSRAAAKANPSAQIFAYDILPEAYHVIFDNIILNDFIGNIYPILMGVGDDGYFFAPFNSASSEMGSSLSLDAESEGSLHVKIKVKTLDEICIPHFIGKKVCIKIDTEGTEVDIFRNSFQTLREIKPDIICEVLPIGREIEVYDRILTSNSYQKYLITDCGLVYFDKVYPDDRFKDWYFTVSPIISFGQDIL